MVDLEGDAEVRSGNKVHKRTEEVAKEQMDKKHLKSSLNIKDKICEFRLCSALSFLLSVLNKNLNHLT